MHIFSLKNYNPLCFLIQRTELEAINIVHEVYFFALLKNVPK